MFAGRKTWMSHYCQCNYLHLQVELILISLFLVREVWGSNPEQINFHHTVSTIDSPRMRL